MLSNYKLISAILGPLLVYGDYALNQLPLLEELLNSQNLPQDLEIKASIPDFSFKGINLINPEISSFAEAVPGSVALIPVTGPLMRNDYCFSAGMATMGRWVDEAAANPNIVAIVQYSNGPGGTTDYTDVLAAKFNSARQVKPVVTYTDGMMCSAQAWIGTSSDYVMVGSDNSIIGSIGTKIEFKVSKEETHVITSDGSENKVKSFEEAKKGNYKLIRAEMLNPLNQNFLAAIKANRPGISEEGLSGKIFIGPAAIAQGLADGRGTFEDAVQKALSLANKNSNSNQNPNSNTEMFGKNKFPKLTALAGMAAADITDDVIAGVNEELTANGIEHAGVISASQLETLEAAQPEVTRLTASNKQLTTDLATAQAEIKKLGALDGDKPTGSAKEGAELQEEGDDENQKAIDALPHNQEWAKNPLFN